MQNYNLDKTVNKKTKILQNELIVTHVIKKKKKKKKKKTVAKEVNFCRRKQSFKINAKLFTSEKILHHRATHSFT